jgi:hypothetical protein
MMAHRPSSLQSALEDAYWRRGNEAVHVFCIKLASQSGLFTARPCPSCLRPLGGCRLGGTIQAARPRHTSGRSAQQANQELDHNHIDREKAILPLYPGKAASAGSTAATTGIATAASSPAAAVASTTRRWLRFLIIIFPTFLSEERGGTNSPVTHRPSSLLALDRFGPCPSPELRATSGERPWFICPGAECGRRVAVLYGPGRYFLCRHCYDLVYQSQRENKIYRSLHRAQNIRKRLGGSANMMEPFPEKPKGMHWQTYERLWWEHHDAEMEQLIRMREWLDKTQQKVS